MYAFLGRFVARHWLGMILFWIALAVTLQLIAPQWDDVTKDGDLAYLPAEMTSVRAEELISNAFPDDNGKSQIVLVLERSEGLLSANDLEFAEQLANRFDLIAPEDPKARQVPKAERGPSTLGPKIEGLPIVDIWTPKSDVVGSKLVSRSSQGDPGQAALVVLSLTNEFMATGNIFVLEKINRALDEARVALAAQHATEVAEARQNNQPEPTPLQLGISGSAAIGGDMLTSARDSIQNTEIATVLLVLGILLVVYRAPVLVLIPLLTIGVAISVSISLVALLTQLHEVPGFGWVDFKVFTTSKIFVVVILFGSGTDFCLFLISRYKEELERGLDNARGVADSLTHVGDALVGSALTTILGLAMMFFADFGKYRHSGPAIALCLAVTLIACLTLSPALLRAFGKTVFWPFGVSGAALRGKSGTVRKLTLYERFWDWSSRVIVARPGLILLGSVLLMSPLAWHGWTSRHDLSYDLLRDMDDSRPSVQGTKLICKHFLAGETGPLTILVRRDGGEFNDVESKGRSEIARLTKELYSVQGSDGTVGIASVRSIAEPLGDTPGVMSVRKMVMIKNPNTLAYFLAQEPGYKGNVARLDVVLSFDPFSNEAADLLSQVERFLLAKSKDRESFWSGAEFDFIGTTSGIRDLRAVTQSDQTLIQRLVVIAVFCVLLVILRRPLLCSYLIVSVLFSYLVTIGATHLLFSWLYQPFPGLDFKVPIFLFVILIAVGEDYNIYLATRVFEEQRRWGLMEGLRIAVAKTGGIITSCGVIMAGTFVSMMTGSLKGMLELGFALSTGVLLDTFVVRPVLVPAFLALLYKWRSESAATPSVAVGPAELQHVSNGAPHAALPHLDRAAHRTARR
jgi:RND superfamily putative drug exporter